MRRELSALLRYAGLKEEEILVYLMLLKLQSATVSVLSNNLQIKQTTLYRTLNRLLGRGLLETKDLNDKQRSFSPLSLQNLINSIDKKQRKIRRLQMRLQNLDPLLPYLDLNNNTKTPEIEIHTGTEAIKEEYLKMPDIFEEEYLHVGHVSNFWRTAGLNYDCAEERGFIARRMKRNIFARSLSIQSPEVERIKANDSKEKRTTIIGISYPVKKDLMLIAEHQINHFVCDEDNPRVIIIKNPELVRFHRQGFEEIWKKG